MVQWTPFIQTYKHRKYQWVQLAGHSGNFKAGQRQGTVMKKLCASEEECYKRLHGDALEAFVPEYQGTLEVEDEESKSKQSKKELAFMRYDSRGATNMRECQIKKHFSCF